MALRPATPEDVGVVHELVLELARYERLEHEVAATADDVRDALFGPAAAATATLACEEEEVVGLALWWWTYSTFLGRRGIWLEDLFVRPERRGRGHGLALLQHLRGLTDGRVEWNVLDWNEPSIRFYRSLGARPVEGWTTYRWLPPACAEPRGEAWPERPAGEAGDSPRPAGTATSPGTS